ncbi:hypothetical protein [Aeromonas salmonicida]|uniref:hypothetical protein n=1 Tax=Aeromonas salmonicida TaxID=645 RepID=UPI00125EAB88|nr:hypothetical protein [Aeromonas salmonicida]HEG4446349.1 hypothetical protein [Aeromonas hydrophila]
MQIDSLSPVVMFVHTRLDHTQKTIESLSQCYLADMTRLIIFSDGARNLQEESQVNRVRSYLKSVVGFREVIVIERQYNFGLAKNIFSGVSEILKNNDVAIVIEDDMLLSRSFLSYMNFNLSRFYNDASIWQISGWTPAVSLSVKDKHELSLVRSQLMPCWGWATWKNRWEKIETDIDIIVNKFTLKDKINFNLGMSYPFYSHIIGNYIKKNTTWAIYWYASAFINNGKSIMPTNSLVTNIGSDGSGNHVPIKIKQEQLTHDINIEMLPLLNEEESSLFMQEVKKNYVNNLSFIQKLSMYIKIFLPLFFWDKLK